MYVIYIYIVCHIYIHAMYIYAMYKYVIYITHTQIYISQQSRDKVISSKSTL